MHDIVQLWELFNLPITLSISLLGAGPVGLTLGLLLKKFDIPITLIERNASLSCKHRVWLG